MAKLAKCEGQLVIKRAGGFENEYFETEFLLSDSVKDVHQARSIIQAGLLHEKLMKDVPQYKNWRECQVVSLETTDAKADTSELEQLLLQCSEAGCVPENLSSYASDASKVKALSKALDRHEARINREREKEKAEAILKLAGS
jgi:hypothetical protein